MHRPVAHTHTHTHISKKVAELAQITGQKMELNVLDDRLNTTIIHLHTTDPSSINRTTGWFDDPDGAIVGGPNADPRQNVPPNTNGKKREGKGEHTHVCICPIIPPPPPTSIDITRRATDGVEIKRVFLPARRGEKWYTVKPIHHLHPDRGGAVGRTVSRSDENTPRCTRRSALGSLFTPVRERGGGGREREKER